MERPTGRRVSPARLVAPCRLACVLLACSGRSKTAVGAREFDFAAARTHERSEGDEAAAERRPRHARLDEGAGQGDASASGGAPSLARSLFLFSRPLCCCCCCCWWLLVGGRSAFHQATRGRRQQDAHAKLTETRDSTSGWASARSLPLRLGRFRLLLPPFVPSSVRCCRLHRQCRTHRRTPPPHTRHVASSHTQSVRRRTRARPHGLQASWLTRLPRLLTRSVLRSVCATDDVLKYTGPTKGPFHARSARHASIGYARGATSSRCGCRSVGSSLASSLPRPSRPPDFLCPLTANTYGIDFLSFKIRDMDTQHVVFEVAKDPNAAPMQYPENFDYNQLRSINYKFPAQFLRYETVGTTSANTTTTSGSTTTRGAHSDASDRPAAEQASLAWPPLLTCPASSPLSSPLVFSSSRLSRPVSASVWALRRCTTFA